MKVVHRCRVVLCVILSLLLIYVHLSRVLKCGAAGALPSCEQRVKVEFADMAAAPWPRCVTYFISSTEIFAEHSLLKERPVAHPGRQATCVVLKEWGRSQDQSLAEADIGIYCQSVLGEKIPCVCVRRSQSHGLNEGLIPTTRLQITANPVSHHDQPDSLRSSRSDFWLHLSSSYYPGTMIRPNRVISGTCQTGRAESHRNTR